MDRTLLLAAGFWIGGAGAWVVAGAHALAPHVRQRWARPAHSGADPSSPRLCDDEEGVGVPACAAAARRGSPSMALPTVPEDSDEECVPDEECVVLGAPPLFQPEDASDLLSESQRRRLAPVNQLRRKRRSRKVARAGAADGEKFVPLVAGARVSQEESILASYAGDDLASRQEQGEDYWLDPVLLQAENTADVARASRREALAQRDTNATRFSPDELRQEIAAPYKANAIGKVVLGVGAAAVVFALFPGLLENDVATSVASFPGTL